MLTAANKLAGTDYSRFLAVDSIDAETISKAKEIFNIRAVRKTMHDIALNGCEKVFLCFTAVLTAL